MYDQKVIISEQFPIHNSIRKHTDVCCTVVSAIFALTLFIIALVVCNRDSYQSKFVNPYVNQCASGFLLYSNAQDSNNRSCVSVCPSGYSILNQGVCIPNDSAIKDKYLSNKVITKSWDDSGFKKTLFYTFIITLGFGLMWMTFVSCFPKFASMVAALGAVLALLLIIIFALISGNSFWNNSIGIKIIVLIICVVLIIVIGGMLCAYQNQIKIQGIMLKYANMFFTQNPFNFIFLPLFVLLAFGLFALIAFQNKCFASAFSKNSDIWDFSNSGFISILNILQFIWGLQFLRDTFNFIISGNTIDWYWTNNSSLFQSFQRLLFRHWGSVVGGSFLNSFFEIPTLILQLLTCHPKTCCSNVGTFCLNSCNIFTCFFNLVRTDAYSYINLSGIPFCNAARNCSELCSKSNQFIGSHSIMKHYRFMTHVFCVATIVFMTQFILCYRVFNIGFWHLVIGVVVIYGFVTWFIDIHANAGQALMVSYMAELELEQDYKFMRKIRPSIKAQLQFLDHHQKQIDGNC